MNKMTNNKFDISVFITSCIGISYDEIMEKADQEAHLVELQLHKGGRGALKLKDDGAIFYLAELKSLLFFLSTGSTPGSGSFQLYRPIVQSLVDSGEFNPAALNVFNLSSSRNLSSLI